MKESPQLSEVIVNGCSREDLEETVSPYICDRIERIDSLLKRRDELIPCNLEEIAVSEFLIL